jgi:hypothetical protein
LASQATTNRLTMSCTLSMAGSYCRESHTSHTPMYMSHATHHLRSSTVLRR